MAQNEVQIKISVDGKDAVVEVSRLKNAFDNLQSSTKNAGSKNTDAFAATTNAQLKAIVAQTRQAGNDVTLGLKNGLNAGTGGVLQSARNLASKLISQVKSVLGIRSPSTVFFGIGRNIVEGLGNGIQSIGGGLTALITAPLLAVAGFAVKAAFSLDNIRQKFVGIEGSVEGANARIKELQKFSQETKGVTFELAAETFGSLKTLGIGDAIIKKETQALGNLGQGADFSRNLLQIFQQGFERGDIKEAIGKVPLFEQILGEVQKKFGVTDIEGLKKLKDSGKLGVEQFLEGFSDAVNNNPVFAKVGETFSIKFAKLVERANAAIEPLGKIIIDRIAPFVERGISLVETFAAGFGNLSPETQNLIITFGAVAAAIGPLLFALGTIVVAVGSVIAAFGAIAGAVAAVGGFGVVATIVVGLTAELALLAAGAAALYFAFQSNFGGIKDFALGAFEIIKTGATTFINFLDVQIGAGIANISAFVTENYGAISETINTVSETINSVINSALAAATSFWKAHGEQITSTVSSAYSLIKTYVYGGFEQIKNVFSLIGQLVNGDYAGAWETAQQIVYQAWKNTTQIVLGAIDLIGKYITYLGSVLLNEGATAFGFLVKTAAFAVAQVINFFVTLPFQIVKYAPQIASAALQIGGAIIAGIKDGILGTSSRAAIADGLTGALTDNAPKLTDYFAQITSGAKEALPELTGASNKASEAIKGMGGNAGAAANKASKAKSEFEQLNESLKKTNAEIRQLQNPNSRTGSLKAEIDSANEFKSSLENVIKLRRELNQPNTSANLPQNLAAGKAEIESLERIKSIRDEVLKVSKEQQEAENGLLVLRLTANAQVVDAETRAQTIYLENIRKRREAEQQQLADLRVAANEYKDLFSGVGQLSVKREAFSKTIVELLGRERENQLASQSEQIKLAILNNDRETFDKLQSEIKISLEKSEIKQLRPIESIDQTAKGILVALNNLPNRLNVNGTSNQSSTFNSSERFNNNGKGVFNGNNELRTTSRNASFDALYSKYGKMYGVDPNILLEQGRQESINFRKSVVENRQKSTAGAAGIGQFMPGTAARFGVDVNSVESSIRGQARYMAVLLKKFEGDYRLALAGYNAGEGRGKFSSGEERLNYFLRNVKETANYSPTIMSKAARALNGKNDLGSQMTEQVKTAKATAKRIPEVKLTTQLSNELPDVNFNFAKMTADAELYKKAIDEINATRGTDSAGREKRQTEVYKAEIYEQEKTVIGSIQKVLRIEQIADDTNRARSNKYNQESEQRIADNFILEQDLANARKGIGLDYQQFLETADKARKESALNTVKEIGAAETYLQKLRNKDSATLKALGETRKLARTNQEIGLNEEIKAQKELLDNGGREKAIEALQLTRERQAALLSVGATEAALEQQRQLNGDAEVTRAREIASITNERTDLEQRLYDIERERATIGANQQLRIRVAGEEELLAIQREQLKAQDDIARAEVRLANAQIFSSDQVRAKILGHLAQQKTVSEATADGIVSAYEKVAGFFDKKIDNSIGKIPIIGDIFGEIAKQQSRSILTGITKGLLDKFLPGLSDSVGKTNNPIARPIVDELQKTNSLLSKIAGINPTLNILGGGGGTSGTGASGGGILGFISKILGGFGGGQSANAGGNNDLMNAATWANGSGGSGGSGGSNLFSQIRGIFSNKEGGIFAPRGNLLNGGKTSALAGTIGGIGQLATIAGGLIGGRFGGILSSAGTGASIGAMFGPWGAAIGAGVGALFGIFSGDPKKKEDKRQNLPALQKGFGESLTQLRDLVAQVRNNPYSADLDGALSKATELRGQIASGFGIEFKSKKYRAEAQKQIALKTVEADSLIRELNDLSGIAREKQKSRSERQSLIAEFATGTFASSDFIRRNGKLYGGIPGKDSLPSLLMAGEMVLNKRQQDLIRRNSGFDVFKTAQIPNYETGTYLPPGIPQPIAPMNRDNYSSGGGNETIEINIPVTMTLAIPMNSGVDESQFERKVERYIRSEKGKTVIVNVQRDIILERRKPNA